MAAMPTLMQWLDSRFLGNTLLDWSLAAAVFAATMLLIPLLRGQVRARQATWRDADNPTLELLAQMLGRTNRLVLISIALYFAEKLLLLPQRVDRVFNVVIVFGVALQAAIWSATALRFYIHRKQVRSGIHDAAARSSVDVLMFVGQIIIWAVFALLALDNLGVNITALVAGMGVGGIAVALAVQTILGDLFGSLSIALDKPFVVGDNLRIDDVEGVVEHIGIKSTRLRSVSGEQIILSNADVLKSRVRNLGRMAERRVQFRLNIAYDTPADKIALVAVLVEQCVRSQPSARFVSCLLAQLGSYAQEFEVTYFVPAGPAIEHPRIVDAVNRGIVERFAVAGIGFAYPTRRNL
jgi:small-conductance mechanosensitive channel